MGEGDEKTENSCWPLCACATGSNQREILYTVRAGIPRHSSLSTVLSFLSLKEVRVDVLTCHNIAFLDIQQKGPAVGRFSFTAAAEWCLKLAC